MKVKNKLVCTSFVISFANMGILHAASIEPKSSSVAIVTEKEGVGAALAHRHIIVSNDFASQINLTLVPGSNAVTSGEASITLKVAELLVDSPNAIGVIMPLLTANGIWDLKKDVIEPSNQVKVRENMLNASQLNGAGFPEIKGTGRFDRCTLKAGNISACTLNLTLTVRDKSVTKSVPLTLTTSGEQLVADFTMPIKFTELGIEPYSTMLGAIRVSDAFVLAGHLAAKQ